MNGYELKQELHTLRDNLKSELKSDMQAIQDHVNQLDVKGQSRGFGSTNTDPLKGLIRKNFNQISGANRSKVRLESKDMTLPVNLTGDAPRDYSNTVSMLPSQLVNVSDLVQSITISGGNYTFPRESTPTGVAAPHVEGDLKSQIDYNLEMVDCVTNFIAGLTVYSKKMANNLPFLENFLPNALKRDYWKAENSEFNDVLVAEATPSTEVITDSNQIEMLIAEISTLEQADYNPNLIVVRPADYWKIMVFEKSDGAGYGLPGVVTYANGMLMINGIPIFKANWLAVDSYFVGDFTRIRKVITSGLSLEFSEHDGENFSRNNVSARIECQCAIAVERPESLIYGNFLNVTPLTSSKKKKK